MITGLFILAPLSINDCVTDFPPNCCHLISATPLWIHAISWLTRNVVWWAWLITHYIIVGPSWPLLIIVFGQAVALFWQHVFFNLPYHLPSVAINFPHYYFMSGKLALWCSGLSTHLPHWDYSSFRVIDASLCIWSLTLAFSSPQIHSDLILSFGGFYLGLLLQAHCPFIGVFLRLDSELWGHLPWAPTPIIAPSWFEVDSRSE